MTACTVVFYTLRHFCSGLSSASLKIIRRKKKTTHKSAVLCFNNGKCKVKLNTYKSIAGHTNTQQDEEIEMRSAYTIQINAVHPMDVNILAREVLISRKD